MYTALYRAQRPEIFSEILGQQHIVRILKNQIETGTVSHAYLFCGTRGTGKTTTARILAKAVNCLDQHEKPCGQCQHCLSIKEGTFMDVIEIDAASNNGVDNIRELKESVKYPPAVGKKKVYIIDEVHMLSTGASNALLKTLEEPPENVIFILATTDPQKLPQTILSRCMRLDFKRVAEQTLMDHMSRISQSRGVTISDGALRLLAANADGSVRDGLSILDQCLSAGDKELDRDMILQFLGTVSEEFFINLTEKTSLGNVAEALVLLNGTLQEGKDVKQLMKDWMAHYRCLLITKYIKNPEDMLNMSTENIEKLRDQSNQISLDEINNGILTLSKTINDARYSTQPRILLELAIVTIASGISDGPTMTGPKPTQAVPRQQMVPKPKAMGEPKVTAEPRGTREATTNQVEETPQIVQTGEEAIAAAGEETIADHSAIQRDSGETDQGDYDLDELWGRIFEEGEDTKGSFNLIRTGTTLAAMTKTEFKVIAQNEFTKQYVERNQKHICDLMEKITGNRMQLACRTADQTESKSKGQAMEDLANEISDKLGINVKVED